MLAVGHTNWSQPTADWYADGGKAEPVLARLIEVFALALCREETQARAVSVQRPEYSFAPERSGQDTADTTVEFRMPQRAGVTFDFDTEVPPIVNTCFYLTRPAQRGEDALREP